MRSQTWLSQTVPSNGATMTKAMKGVLLLFVLLGIAAVVYGAWQIRDTRALVASATGRTTAEFVGYFREYHRVPSGLSLKGSGVPSVASYPEFSYRAEVGLRTVREARVHIIERYEAGQPVEILLMRQGEPRLASFYSLYALDLLILISGLAFVFLSGGFWRYVAPQFLPTGHAQRADRPSDSIVIEQSFGRFLDQKIGPLSARTILVASGVFM